MTEKPIVKQCPTCKKIKKFGEWVEQTRTIWKGIAAKSIIPHFEFCQNCIPGKTNRLLPVADN